MEYICKPICWQVKSFTISTQAVKHTGCVQYTAERLHTINQADVKV